MKLDLSNILDKSEVYFQSDGEIDPNKENYSKIGDIKIISPVKYNVEIFELDSQDRELNLTLNFTYEEPCHRCLEPTSVEITAEVFGQIIEGNEEEHESELTEEEKLVNYFYTIDGLLDLDEVIRTQVNLSIPMKTICNDSCKGLCSQCGVNLNISKCNCEDNQIDPRLAVLKDMFGEK